MVFVITSLIGGFGTVHVIWLANVTVRLQPIVRLHCPITTLLVKDEAINAPIKFEEIALVVINDEIARGPSPDFPEWLTDSSPTRQECLLPMHCG